MDKKQLKIILEQHKKWLEDHEKGKKADLKGADLEGANLDFSAFPLNCRSLDIKVCDRLPLQLFFHICRMDITKCNPELQHTIHNLPDLAKNGFIEYRRDIKNRRIP